MRLTGGPIVKDVVLVGAGHAHVAVLRRFGMKPLPGVRFTLIARELHTPYSGMLPGLVAGLYGFDDAHIDTGPLARFAGARLYHDTAIGLDLTSKWVICRDRPPVPYDLVSLDMGSTPNTGLTPGAAEHAIPVKPISAFLPRLEALITRVCRQGKAAHGSRLLGPVRAGWNSFSRWSVAYAARWRKRAMIPAVSPHPRVRLGRILPDFPKAFRRRFERDLRRARHRGRDRCARNAGRGRRPALRALRPTSRRRDPLDHAAPPPLRGSPRPASSSMRSGFVRVDACLRAEDRNDVFAAGDIAAFGPRDLPKSGVYAVRAGPVLADNIRRTLTGEPLRPFRPQREALYLVSTGERHAIGTRNGLVVEGDWVWRWKDFIDRRFMRQFNELPAMPEPAGGPTSPLADQVAVKELSAIAMRCGGCGAKVGTTVLSRALGNIAPATRDDVVVGLDSPDDAAVIDTGGPKLSVHTVDYFRAMVDDPYLFGKIAANHALGDIFAMGATPDGARHRHDPVWAGGQGRGGPLGHDGRRQRNFERGRLRTRGRAHQRRRGTCARLCRRRTRGSRRRPPQGRPRTRRRADPHQTDRHGHPACGRYARESQGAVGRGALEHMTRSTAWLQPFCGGMAFMRQPT